MRGGLDVRLAEERLRAILVHRERAREYSRAGVDDPGGLEERLDRAVLSRAPVQRDEDDVRGADRLRVQPRERLVGRERRELAGRTLADLRRARLRVRPGRKRRIDRMRPRALRARSAFRIAGAARERDVPLRRIPAEKNRHLHCRTFASRAPLTASPFRRARSEWPEARSPCRGSP